MLGRRKGEKTSSVKFTQKKEKRQVHCHHYGENVLKSFEKD